jgi:hypothetical protein
MIVERKKYYLNKFNVLKALILKYWRKVLRRLTGQFKFLRPLGGS